MDEHVKEQMFSHLRDLTKEFGALKYEQAGLLAPKSRSRRTRDGVEAQEQASQDVSLGSLATTCQQQKAEIDGLKNLVHCMGGTMEHLVCQLTESQASLCMRLNNLESRCQQQQTEIGGYLDELRTRVETPLQAFSIRLVRRDRAVTPGKSTAPCANSHRCYLCFFRTA